jgi:hypothetical protein
VEKRVSKASASGDRKTATLFGSNRGRFAVQNPPVIRQPLTPVPPNSFPEAFFIHRSGKAAERAIQTGMYVVKGMWNAVNKVVICNFEQPQKKGYPRIHQDNSSSLFLNNNY